MPHRMSYTPPSNGKKVPAMGASILSFRICRLMPAEVRTLALSIVRERYSDFGPSLAAEKLAEHHGRSVSRETLRGWRIADGLWQDRRHRLPTCSLALLPEREGRRISRAGGAIAWANWSR